MSSDFNINLKEIVKAGVVITLEWNDDYNDKQQTMKIPTFQYLRECEVSGDELLVSAGGQFRTRFHTWLTDNKIPFDVH